MKSIVDVFGGRVYSCSFHFGNNVVRHLKSEGLQTAFLFLDNSRLVNQWSNNGCRTTNFAEGFNRRLQYVFSTTHPPLGEFLHVMRQELTDATTHAKRIVFNNDQIKLRKRKYRKSERHYQCTKNEIIVDELTIEIAILTFT